MSLTITEQFARGGVLSKWEFALESATARICCEVGGRVTTNVLVRDLDLEGPGGLGQADARRLEVAVDGLPLFGGTARSRRDQTLLRQF